MIKITGYEEQLKKILNGKAFQISLKQRIIIFLTELMEIHELPVEIDALTEQCFPELVERIGKELKLIEGM